MEVLDFLELFLGLADSFDEVDGLFLFLGQIQLLERGLEGFEFADGGFLRGLGLFEALLVEVFSGEDHVFLDGLFFGLVGGLVDAESEGGISRLRLLRVLAGGADEGLHILGQPVLCINHVGAGFAFRGGEVRGFG